MSLVDSSVVNYVRQAAFDDRYGAYLRNTLLELCLINTAPGSDPDGMAGRERELFDWIEREVRELLGSDAKVERPVIDPTIGDDPAYVRTGYSGEQEGADCVYANRCNLEVAVGDVSAGASPLIVHTGVDSMGRWFAPRSAGQRVFGRGACDSRAQMAMMLGQMKLLREIEEKLNRRLDRSRVYRFVVDSDTGGNGALSLLSDTRWAGSPVLVHGCTDLMPCCGGVGVVWYRCRLSIGPGEPFGAVELMPFVVQALEAENRKLREETVDFSRECVQVNHGILGDFGSDPATVSDHVAVEIVAQSKANPERVGMRITEFLEDALADYVQAYGDKTREHDPGTGQPMVDRHFAVQVEPTADAQVFRIDAWGRKGHMEAVGQCDGAITKMAYLLGGLLRVAPSFPGIRAMMRLAERADEVSEVVLAGAQSFSPAHPVSDVQERMAAAVSRGVEEYCRIRGCRAENVTAEMTYDRSAESAYAEEGSAFMSALREGLDAVGEPMSGLSLCPRSSDARLYHAKGYPVTTFGPGKPVNARSDNEYIDVPEVQKALAVSTLAMLSMAT